MSCTRTRVDLRTFPQFVDSEGNCKKCNRLFDDHPPEPITDPSSVLKVFKEDFERNKKFYFPPEGLGIKDFSRDVAANYAMNLINEQLERDWGIASVYLHGPRASGKSIILQLLAKRLTDLGFTVYYYGPGVDLPVDMLSALPSSGNAKVAVLVDEVPAASNGIVSLLKSNRKGLVVIGAGVPEFLPSGFNAYFKSKISVELQLTMGSSDMNDLINHWKSLKVTDDDVVTQICSFLCDYCGGHYFPIARFMEYAFTDEAAVMHRKSIEDFKTHFFSQSFHDSQAYSDVMVRCFEDDLCVSNKAVLLRVLSGKGTSVDINSMISLGWWSYEKNDIISTLLANVCLCDVKADQSAGLLPMKLEKTDDVQENIEKLIVEGLWRMHPSDFICSGNDFQTNTRNIKIDDSISFCWGQSVMKAFSNALLQFQSRAHSGRVKFFVDGNFNCVIENVLNDVSGQGGSLGMSSEYIGRFNNRNKWDTGAVLNFAISSEHKPRTSDDLCIFQPSIMESDVQDAVVQEDARVYTFDYTENALYHGTNIIQRPAVKSLHYSNEKHVFVPLAMRKKRLLSGTTYEGRQYSTLARPCILPRVSLKGLGRVLMR